jgi:hypothetical protein
MSRKTHNPIRKKATCVRCGRKRWRYRMECLGERAYDRGMIWRCKEIEDCWTFRAKTTPTRGDAAE